MDRPQLLQTLRQAHDRRLLAGRPVLYGALRGGLRGLRVAEFNPRARRGGTRIALGAGAADATAQAAAVTRLARNGFSDLRLRLVAQSDLVAPAAADDPWACMLALEASVSLSRAAPDQAFLVR